MLFSSQQIKFEFLSYIKEFDLDPSAWRVGLAEDARTALFTDNGVDEATDIWIWKPAATAAAAAIVFSFFTHRVGIQPTAQVWTASTNCVFLFRKA